LTAVDQVSFEIGRGEIVGLLGHNGAGKTTIMKMLTGYLEPTNGSIEIDGLDISKDREAVQQRIGYLPENDPLYLEMTVIDYLDYSATLHGVPDAERTDRIREAIDKTELSSKVTDTIGTLSRGFCQRVGVAQAILHQPKIVILDEPTNGLDPTQILQMRELIRDLATQSTVLISTHVLQEVQAVCERVLILRNGQLALDSLISELDKGGRLLLSVNADARNVLARVQGIVSVEEQSVEAGQVTYAIESTADVAHQVAHAVHAAGLRLYRLQPEARNLETVFADVNEGRIGESS
jgi:ABC-2 type transport system ATP-binding protein